MRQDAVHSGRREFLKLAGLAGIAGGTTRCFAGDRVTGDALHEALYYEKLDGGLVRCGLCPWECVVAPGNRGRCKVRENRDGTYYTLVYGRPCAANNDPIEKKPLFHVRPGTKALSIATVGCNIHCKFCQNWDISQSPPEKVTVPFRTPRDIVNAAVAAGSTSIAYTYSEPTIFFEYMIDCARAARTAGLQNVVISNGFISEAPLRQLTGLVDAIKIDLKAFTEAFYANVCEGQLRPVLETLKRLKGSGVWFEIVVLVVPTLNDSSDEIGKMTDWIVEELGPDVPVHFTRFHNAYKIRNLHSTPPKTLQRCRSIAIEAGCRYVYTGNMPGEEAENTYCPACKAMLVRRYGFRVLANNLDHGTCRSCGASIPGLW